MYFPNLEIEKKRDKQRYCKIGKKKTEEAPDRYHPLGAPSAKE